jgi:hypothetical protein
MMKRARLERAVRVEIDGNSGWIGDDVAGSHVQCQRAAVETLLPGHDFESDAIVVDTVTAVNTEIGIERIVETNTGASATEVVMARALIERLHDRIALPIPAQVLGNVDERTADRVVVVVCSVNGDVSTASNLPCGSNDYGVLLGWIEVRRRRIAGDEARKLQIVAPVERQGFDLE